MNDILVTILIIIVAYLVGLTIVNVVDNRLSDISINMPQINLPQNPISIKLDDDTRVYHSSGQNNYQITPGDGRRAVKVKNENGQEGGNSEEMCDSDFQGRGRLDSDDYRSVAQKTDRVSSEDEVIYAQIKSLPAIAVHRHGNNQLVPTHYKNPKEMSIAQIIKFRNHARFSKMTVGDYENWLLLFRTDPHNLNRVNRNNLIRVLKGDRLDSSDIPMIVNPEPPRSAENYFNDSYNGHPTKLANSDTAGKQLASNFDDFVQFSTPNELKHLRHMNTDELRKNNNGHVLDQVRPTISYKNQEISKTLTSA